MSNNEEKIEELEEIEEKLISEEEKSKKTEMPVSGKSVFEIQRIKKKHK